MQVDDPPYLSVGTAVSAKYKGAFCEAKVSKVDRIVKCKITYKSGLGTSIVNDIDIRGTLRVGQQVQAKHPDHKELVEATIIKIQDCSQYTVVFDDGDITTLRRTALCLKSGRHFNESETLDQLPLTHPEHFCNPVFGGRRGRRNRLLKDDSSDEEIEEENEPDLEGYSQDIGKVVSVETGENKRGREKWFPGLIVIPSAQPTVKINIKDEFLIRSFRDDRYYTVPKKEVNEFNRDQAEKSDTSGLAEAIQKAIKFLDHNELPLHWEKNLLFNISGDSNSEENASESSDDEQSEEKDRFVAQLYKFMDESGTPLNKTPTIANKDIDLHRLFRIVHKMGGYNRVTNQNKWKSVTSKMKLPVNQNVSNQVKSVYKKCLWNYESFHKNLGVTMLNPTRATKKNKGRSLIRDKDRTPISSPRPEREDELAEKQPEKKETPVVEKTEIKIKRKLENKEKDESKKVKSVETRDSSSDVSDVASTSSTRPKRYETKLVKDKKFKQAQGERVKVMVERLEDLVKREEKVQFTRSKSLTNIKTKDTTKEIIATRQTKETKETITSSKLTPKPIKKVLNREEEDKERKVKPRKKLTSESEKSSESISSTELISANVGDKLIVYYGPTNESKVTYEAKVVNIDKDQTGPIYLVHYTGWNTRYDEWIPASRIADNLSSGSKTKRSKVPAPVNVKPSSNTPSTSGTKHVAAKRSRVSSVSNRSNPEEKPARSTTPSSVTSTSSRTKSPATPATRSNRVSARQESLKKRRASAQTDISVQSNSDSNSSESEAELPRTRSGSLKSEETENRVYKKRMSRSIPTSKLQKRKEQKDGDDTEKEDDADIFTKDRVIKKIKRSPEKSNEDSEDDEDSSGHPKGRDFDLNQIRLELKGFSKALKTPLETEKDSVSSSDESGLNVIAPVKEEMEEESIKDESKPTKHTPKSPKLEKSSSSEDIYEFKEPEPFEFESRSKLVDDKCVKKRLPRIYDDLDRSPRKRGAKSPSSPGRSDKLDLPEPRTYSRLPKKINISEDEEDEDELVIQEEEEAGSSVVKKEDPFDKLIESPSFNFKVSPEKLVEAKPEPSNFLEEPLSFFKELPDNSDEYSRDMELSDCEPQTQIFTRAETLFTNTFPKSPDRNTPGSECSGVKTDEGKVTNSDDDEIQAQIQRVIARTSSTDDDSNDVLMRAPTPTVESPKKAEEQAESSIVDEMAPLVDETPLSVDKAPVVPPVAEIVECEPLVEKKEIEVSKSEPPPPPPPEEIKDVKPPSPKKPIDPALQESDSSLLELIVSKPPLILDPKLDDTVKELTVKTGTKIADSILQKFNFIKNNIDSKSSKSEPIPSTSAVSDRLDVKPSTSKMEPFIIEYKPKLSLEIKPKKTVVDTVEEKLTKSPSETKTKAGDSSKIKVEDSKPSLSKAVVETKRRKKAISKPYIDESESDSSDSEHLVIVRSDDEESQTSLPDAKSVMECKESPESGTSVSKPIFEDSSSQDQEVKKTDDAKLKEESEDTVKNPKELTGHVKDVDIKSDDVPKQEEQAKEEQDPSLHSLLLCEEEIPRSPAPIPDLSNLAEVPSTSGSVHEIPFASAPGTSNSKMLLEPKRIQPPPLVMPPERERSEAQTVIENTPPTTPESTLSNLSPRGDNGNISPNSNESKSNEGEPDFGAEHRRSSSVKVSPYSEEDTQTGGDIPTSKKPSDTCAPPISCRKRRRSLRISEDGPSSVVGVPMPTKRGRKPRQRRDSDSDDASECSLAGSGGGGNTPRSTSSYDRSARSPRPSKYNFFVEFDPSLDSGQRIAVLQQKLSELRKTYADVKTELAAVERRRKKIRRREREALKSAKQQELACS